MQSLEASVLLGRSGRDDLDPDLDLDRNRVGRGVRATRSLGDPRHLVVGFAKPFQPLVARLATNAEHHRRSHSRTNVVRSFIVSVAFQGMGNDGR